MHEQLAFSFPARPRPLPVPPPAPSVPAPPSVLSCVRRLLLALHGPQRLGARAEPLDQFVQALLGRRTRDEIAFPAVKRLQYRYKSWDAVRVAPTGEIAHLIRTLPDARRKAEQLQQSLGRIAAQAGRLDLAFLHDWPEARAMAWLMTLPGAGLKAASATLNWSTLRKRVLVVDPPLLRIARRLGLLPESADMSRGYEILMRLVPADWDADDLAELHGLMTRHSQRVCLYEMPACFRCPLRDLCPRATMPH